jgi:anti-anti-sigma regulatory factor
MPITTLPIKIEAERVEDCVLKACADLSSIHAEPVLDFSCVRRVDAKAVRAMEELARLAEVQNVKIGLRGVNVEIYKVLKLVKLAPRFSFLN